MDLAIRHATSPTGDAVYWPTDAPPRGGIVCLHGSDGGFAGWNHMHCAVLAAHGFVALARNYSRSHPGIGTPDIDDVALDGTETALRDLEREVAPHGCGVGLFGYSRGAEHALLVAQLLAEDGSPVLPRAVAAHSPPDAAWPAFLVSDFETGEPWAGDPDRPAWSWRGEHHRTRPGTVLGALPCPYPVFIAQGTADSVWSADMARRLVERMIAAGRAPEAHFFEDEDHWFRAEARNREWALLVEFFGRHLAGSPSRVTASPHP